MGNEGYSGIQGSHPWLKDTLLFSETVEDWKVLLLTIMMLLNYWTCNDGLTQLPSTYYPIFNKIGNHASNMFIWIRLDIS